MVPLAQPMLFELKSFNLETNRNKKVLFNPLTICTLEYKCHLGVKSFFIIQSYAGWTSHLLGDKRDVKQHMAKSRWSVAPVAVGFVAPIWGVTFGTESGRAAPASWTPQLLNKLLTNSWTSYYTHSWKKILDKLLTDTWQTLDKLLSFCASPPQIPVTSRVQLSEAKKKGMNY